MQGLVFLDSVVNMPLMSLPVRSVVAATKNGQVLISPGSKITKAQYQGVGQIATIVAPNLLHCAGVPLAVSCFPKAEVWGPEGVRKQKPDMPWQKELNEAPWPYEDELLPVFIGGMPKVNETVFLHKKSKTLIVTDLCFNMQNVKGIGAWIILNLFGTYKKFGVSKFYVKFVKDQDAFKGSLAALFKHDFENIVLSHGFNIIGGGKEKLMAALNERGY